MCGACRATTPDPDTAERTEPLGGRYILVQDELIIATPERRIVALIPNIK